jgi:predicted nucleic acid-binding protein
VIVLDASAALEWLLQTRPGELIEERIYAQNESLHAPHLLDLEVVQAMRRLTRAEILSTSRAEEAISDLLDARITRYPHFAFLPGIWRHRNNLSAYDASYVALAERLGAVLITHDRRLAAASGHRARIELF